MYMINSVRVSAPGIRINFNVHRRFAFFLIKLLKTIAKYSNVLRVGKLGQHTTDMVIWFIVLLTMTTEICASDGRFKHL